MTQLDQAQQPRRDLSSERPASLGLALRALLALIVVSGITVVLICVFRDSLIRSWAEGNPEASHVLHTQGLDAVKNGSVKPPHFVVPAITLFVTFAGLLGVLATFVRNGFEWSRIGITVLLGFGTVATIAALLTGLPALFVVCSAVAMAVGLVAVLALWMPATTRYIHPSTPLG
jgi:hypothetical protein